MTKAKLTIFITEPPQTNTPADNLFRGYGGNNELVRLIRVAADVLARDDVRFGDSFQGYLTDALGRDVGFIELVNP